MKSGSRQDLVEAATNVNTLSQVVSLIILIVSVYLMLFCSCITLLLLEVMVGFCHVGSEDDIIHMLEHNYSVAERDRHGTTPRDCAEKAGLDENVNAIGISQLHHLPELL